AAAERRAAPRLFDQIIVEHASDAVARNDDLAVLVVFVVDTMLHPDATRMSIASMREHLRATDLVGRLASGDFGILLLHTPKDGATIAAQRIQDLLRAYRGPGELPGARVGIVSDPRNALSAEALLGAAHLNLADSSA